MNGNSETVRVIRPNIRFEHGWLRCFLQMMGNIIRHKNLIVQLVKRDLFSLNKKSFIGTTWIIISPVIGIISWFFLQRTHILNPGNTAVPYPAYLLLGTLLWGCFMSVFSAVSASLSSHKHLISQASFPHETLFMAQTLLRTIHFAASLLLVFGIFALLNIPMDWKTIFFPFTLIPLLLYAVSIGLIVSAFSIVSYDVNRLVTGGFSLIMFITPVIYSPEIIKNQALKNIIQVNPLTHILCSARDIVFHGTLYSTDGFVISSLFSVLCFFVSWRIFYVSEEKVIERLL